MSRQRVLNSIKADITFQLKHGFYAVYVILSIVYIIILSFIPTAAAKYVLPVLIFFDPAGLGLFFIGGMVLLEKEQGVLALLYITPLKVQEYILSKVLTLGAISVLAGFAISLASYGLAANYLLLFLGIFLVSIFYTLFGFLVASRSRTVNDYLVKMIPAIILSIIPCVSLIPNDIVPEFINSLLLLVPSAGGLKLMFGAYSGISLLEITLSIVGLIIINILLLKRVAKVLTDKVILNA